jgi:hypothetical protein
VSGFILDSVASFTPVMSMFGFDENKMMILMNNALDINYEMVKKSQENADLTKMMSNTCVREHTAHFCEYITTKSLPL